MNVIVKFPNAESEKKQLETNTSFLHAYLIYERLKSLNLSNQQYENVLKEIDILLSNHP